MYYIFIILVYLSHSMSHDGLLFIFKVLLPTLKDKIVLDIGSRLGAVLYGVKILEIIYYCICNRDNVVNKLIYYRISNKKVFIYNIYNNNLLNILISGFQAYVYTDARKIIGVEMNEEFCNLQNEIICKYKMDDRISILHKRIEEVPEIIKQSNVIIINNSFEFYLSRDVQIGIWKFLKVAIKPGTLLITRPSVEAIFKTLSIGISVEKWLKPLKKPHSNKFSFLSDYKDKFAEILYYKVL